MEIEYLILSLLVHSLHGAARDQLQAAHASVPRLWWKLASEAAGTRDGVSSAVGIVHEMLLLMDLARLGAPRLAFGFAHCGIGLRYGSGQAAPHALSCDLTLRVPYKYWTHCMGGLHGPAVLSVSGQRGAPYCLRSGTV